MQKLSGGIDSSSGWKVAVILQKLNSMINRGNIKYSHYFAKIVIVIGRLQPLYIRAIQSHRVIPVARGRLTYCCTNFYQSGGFESRKVSLFIQNFISSILASQQGSLDCWTKSNYADYLPDKIFSIHIYLIISLLYPIPRHFRYDCA